MEFRESVEDSRFRAEIRSFLKEALPADWAGDEYNDSQDAWDYARAFNRKLAAKGWMAPAWPKEYGGMGLSYAQQALFTEEMYYNRAPKQGPRTVATGFAGPSIMMFGTDEQKRQHLPGITSGEMTWCQGFSEPGAGSDLASLTTRARRDGDDWVISGQKIWTSHGHQSDWMFMLARTDPDAPKHKGISYFLADVKNTPGLTFRPIVNLVGFHDLNETFFDDARLPASSLLGEENRGWYQATTTLDFERSSVSGTASARRNIEEVVEYVQQRQPTDAVRTALADRALEIQVGRWLSWRVVSIQMAGGVPNAEASVAKLYNSEMGQRVARTCLQVTGLAGNLRQGSKRAQLGGHATMAYMAVIPATIAGGSSEVQRNIIATRGLGLPRG